MKMAGWKWALVLSVGLILLWRIFSVNITQYVSALTPELAARWHVATTEKTLEQAAELAASDPQRAYAIVSRVAQNDPLQAKAWLLLALMQEGNGQLEQSKRLMRWLATAFPNRADIQLQLGNFWARQSDLLSALRAWGRAMEMQPELRAQLYPELLKLVEQPKHYADVSTVFAETSHWGDDFFRYAVKNAAYAQTLKVLYQSRLKAKTMLANEIRKDYLNRLMRESMLTDAYFVWLNGLNETQQLALGNVYDGGFEQDAPAEGFAWRFTEVEGLSIKAQQTQGASGLNALHVAFKGARRNPAQLAAQSLLLDTGRYSLSGRVKVDNLAAVNGVRWQLICLSTSAEKLATSEYFIDKTQWRRFDFTFEVPDACPAQELRLLLDSADMTRANLTGSLWFDDVAVTRK